MSIKQIKYKSQITLCWYYLLGRQETQVTVCIHSVYTLRHFDFILVVFYKEFIFLFCRYVKFLYYLIYNPIFLFLIYISDPEHKYRKLKYHFLERKNLFLCSF